MKPRAEASGGPRVLLRHSRDGRAFLMSGSSLTIGSATPADVRLLERGIAPLHVKIAISKLGIEADDLSPIGGEIVPLAVNGYSGRKQLLSHRDRLSIGDAELVLELVQRDKAAPEELCTACGALLEEGLTRSAVDAERRCTICAGREQPDPFLDAAALASPETSFVEEFISEQWRSSVDVEEPPRDAGEAEVDSEEARSLAQILDEEWKSASRADDVVPAGKPTGFWEPDYTPLAVIGEGTQGRVFKLRHLATGRLVAAKRLHATTRKALARFEREVEALARLKHPTIIAIYGYKRLADGAVIFTEYVDGPNLEQAVKSGTLGSTGTILALGRSWRKGSRSPPRAGSSTAT